MRDNILVLLVLAACTACGSDGQDRQKTPGKPWESRTPDGQNLTKPLSCAPGEIKIAGTLDGKDYELTTTIVSDPSAEAPDGAVHFMAFSVGEGAGQLTFDLEAKPEIDDDTKARIGLRHADVTSIRVGNCKTQDYPSSLVLKQPDESAKDNAVAGRFTMRSLYATDEVGCLKTSYTGTLQGCFATK